MAASKNRDKKVSGSSSGGPLHSPVKPDELKVASNDPLIAQQVADVLKQSGLKVGVQVTQLSVESRILPTPEELSEYEKILAGILIIAFMTGAIPKWLVSKLGKNSE